MNDDINKLLNSTCRQYSNEDSAMNLSEVEAIRHLTPQWQFCANDNELCRVFHFESYADTIEFVNSVASIAEKQNHHPDLLVSYRRCRVSYTTHSVKGVTNNDFICAAQIDLCLTK